MRKILILDHVFNIQSMSGCTSIYPDIIFYSLNPKLSINDNFDLIDPDDVLINNFFVNQSLVNSILKVKNDPIINNIPYILPNTFATIEQTLNNNCVACIIDNTVLKKDKIYKQNNQYYRIFNVSQNINHIQHYGSIISCKDLSAVIMSHDYIIIDNPIFSSICSFYKKQFRYMNEKQDINYNNYRTNKDVLYDILK